MLLYFYSLVPPVTNSPIQAQPCKVFSSILLENADFLLIAPTLETLMNHTFLKAGVDDSFQSDFQYMQENFPDVDIVLGEVGRFTDSQSSTDPLEGIFGSALWTADYLLYAMSLVSRFSINSHINEIFLLTICEHTERDKGQYATEQGFRIRGLASSCL